MIANIPSEDITFAVIIPTFNRPNYLCQALDSILAQTYSKWVVVVANDASTADYRDVERKYADPRIHFLHRTINGGCNAARNTAIDHAFKLNADFITLLDDEEWFAPECLSKARSMIMAHPDYSWFVSNNFGERKSNTNDIVVEGPMDWIDDYLYGKALRGDKTHMISTRVLGDTRFGGQYRASNMWPFFGPLSLRTKIYAYPFPSKHIQYLEGGITKTKHKYPRHLNVIYSKFARHAFVIRHRPGKWAAYKYLTLELLKTPGRFTHYCIGRYLDKGGA